MFLASDLLIKARPPQRSDLTRVSINRTWNARTWCEAQAFWWHLRDLASSLNVVFDAGDLAYARTEQVATDIARRIQRDWKPVKADAVLREGKHAEFFGAYERELVGALGEPRALPMSNDEEELAAGSAGRTRDELGAEDTYGDGSPEAIPSLAVAALPRS